MSEPTPFGDMLLIPVGIEGHVTPFMYLARRMLKRGISCTLLLEQQGAGALEHNFNKHGALDISDGFYVKMVPTLPAKSVPEALAKWGLSNQPILEELVQCRRDGGKIPSCMIVDQFGGWTNRWAKELAIPRYVFTLSAATYAYWMYKYSGLIRRDNLLERKDEDPVLDLPGAPEVHLSEASTSASRVPEMFTSTGDTFDDAAGILINTFYEMEDTVIDNFRSQLDTAGGIKTEGREQTKVLPIGPIPPPKSIGEAALGRPEKDSACIQWLDTRPPGSVVYIAFGSLAALAANQILELAKALEATNVSFLWILLMKSGVLGQSESSDILKALPPGFQERTKDQGLVHPFFAPQLQILEHPATGVFLTHCGWNSALESVCRGVPLIGWPRQSEQLHTCRVLEHAGVAARIRPEITGESDLLTSAELEKALRTWTIEGPGRARLKERTLELQQRAREAVAPGGSSYQNFEGFIQKFVPKS